MVWGSRLGFAFRTRPRHTASQRVTGALSFRIHAGQRIHGSREFGYGEGMADAPDLAGITPLGDMLGDAWAHYLGKLDDRHDRVLLAAALLVTLVPQRVLDRPDPQPMTLVPRWTVTLLRATI